MTFALGLAVGSFLNVCIWRMPRDESVVRPPSHCPACDARLRARDLVPVFSFLLQGRKCRYCKAPISWRYAVVELTTAVAFLGLYLVDGAGAPLLFDALLVAALIAIFAIDLEHYIIPHELNYFLMFTGVAREVYGRLATGQWSHPVHLLGIPVPASVVGIALGVAVFAGIGWLGQLAFRQESMGGGDLRLAAGIGAHLGWLGLTASVVLAVVAGAVVGVGLIATGLRKRREYIPFGPFIVLGALAVVYAGQWVVPGFLALYGFHPENVPIRSWP
ncbi:MAG: prepilin peptidase [Armatimonadetes bacterium]|nr:prepilin peptidase [Armatimonadota bacterium]